MSERVTKEQLNERVRNVNRRLNPERTPMEFGTNGRYVLVNGRNGYTALDEYEGPTMLRTITAGSKREVSEFLHAMMVGIDLADVARPISQFAKDHVVVIEVKD